MQIKIDADRLRRELDTLATFTHAEPVANGHCGYAHRLFR